MLQVSFYSPHPPNSVRAAPLALFTLFATCRPAESRINRRMASSPKCAWSQLCVNFFLRKTLEGSFVLPSGGNSSLSPPPTVVPPCRGIMSPWVCSLDACAFFHPPVLDDFSFFCWLQSFCLSLSVEDIVPTSGKPRGIPILGDWQPPRPVTRLSLFRPYFFRSSCCPVPRPPCSSLRLKLQDAFFFH